MPAVFRLSHHVLPEEIDAQGHAGNVVYFTWLQRAALAHSAEQGWSGETYAARHWSWVVRTHFIEYRKPLFVNDSVEVQTWVADMSKFTSLRKYTIYRGSELIARAETNWAFVDTKTGRLQPIPDEIRSAFQLVTSPTSSGGSVTV
jgi:acyl-CoA thioester hydrolase